MQRIRQLDGVRALAILAVFVHHALNVKMHINVHGLWMGVDLFFVLSGFLITGVLLRAKHQKLGGYFAHFYSRRARRLLAPYLLILVLSSLIFGIGWMQHWYMYILLTNLLTPLHMAHPAAFEPLWSLAVEEQFYLAWPFAVYFLTERQLRHLCVLLLVLAPVLRGSFHFTLHWPIYELTPFRMDLLAAGSLIFLEWRRHREAIELWGTLAGTVVGGIGLAGLLLLSHRGISTFTNTPAANILVYESTLFISVGITLYALAGRGVGWLCTRPMRYIGQVSYSMYLVHMCTLEVIMGVWPHSFAAAAVAFALTFGYAAISWSAMESRLLGRNHRPRRAQIEPDATTLEA